MTHRTNAFSPMHIDKCHHLMTEHNYSPEKIAEVMNTSLRNVMQLIKLAERKYPKPIQAVNKESTPAAKRYVHDSRTDDLVKKLPTKFVRPKAEYSNSRLYDLI